MIDADMVAVVTGDVVASSALPPEPRRELPALIERAVAQAMRGLDVELLPTGVFRGDSWQTVVTPAVAGLRVGLFVRAYLIGYGRPNRVDTRFVVGIGDIDFLPPDNPAAADGEAFRLSGKTLGTMQRPPHMRLLLPGGEEPAATTAVLTLMDAIVRGWTARQAQAVVGALSGRTQEEIAASWIPPVAQQTIATHLERAEWASVEHGIDHVENSLRRT